ncbi:hypothetical protein [Streptomyces sp. NPDC093097]|uniref:hypothetical protein n=1 Tax=Streptomyces sp. NPDC093097 TaxID=3366027 RepID=UPI0037FF6116
MLNPETAGHGGAEAPAEESGRRLLQRRFTARLLPQLRLRGPLRCGGDGGGPAPLT